MQEYRAYLIGPDGHFVKRVELVCADDEAAKEQGKSPSRWVRRRALAGGSQNYRVRGLSSAPRTSGR